MREVPLRARHQRHELRLQIGREARERRGRHVDRREADAVARDADAVVGRVDRRAGLRAARRARPAAAPARAFCSSTSPPVIATAIA